MALTHQKYPVSIRIAQREREREREQSKDSDFRFGNVDRSLSKPYGLFTPIHFRFTRERERESVAQGPGPKSFSTHYDFTFPMSGKSKLHSGNALKMEENNWIIFGENFTFGPCSLEKVLIWSLLF